MVEELKTSLELSDDEIFETLRQKGKEEGLAWIESLEKNQAEVLQLLRRQERTKLELDNVLRFFILEAVRRSLRGPLESFRKDMQESQDDLRYRDCMRGETRKPPTDCVLG